MPISRAVSSTVIVALTRRPDDAANVEDNVLGGDPLGQFSIDADEHVLGLGLRKRRGGQHMLDLGSANPKRHGPKGTVRGRVAVATNGRAARQRESLLGSDDVDDALPLVGHSKILEAKVGDVLLQLQHLGAGGGLLNEGLDRDEVGAVGRRDVVIDCDEGAVGPTDRAAGQAQPLKGLGGGHLLYWGEGGHKKDRSEKRR